MLNPEERSDEHVRYAQCKGLREYLMKERSWLVYILRCKDDSLYTGITNDLQERIKTHNSGEGAKYTRARIPVRLVYQETCSDKSTVRKREIEIKGWTREKKEKLVAGFLRPK